MQCHHFRLDDFDCHDGSRTPRVRHGASLREADRTTVCIDGAQVQPDAGVRSSLLATRPRPAPNILLLSRTRAPVSHAHLALAPAPTPLLLV